MKTLVWFRNDLRSVDNTALHRAAQTEQTLRALYIATPGQWREHHLSQRQQSLIQLAVHALADRLAGLGIVLDVEICEHYSDIPTFLDRYCEQHGISALHANREYLYNEMRRDEAVATALNIPCHWHHDRLIAEPGTLLNGSGQPYKVFTPFAKRWRARLNETSISPLRRPKARAKALPTPALSTFAPELPLPGWPRDEESALKQLRSFCTERVQDYDRHRDIPALDGTSRLSAALAIGLISPRQCLARLQAEAGKRLQESDGGESTWLNELVWREFYQHVAFHFPRVVKGHAFKPETDNIRWSNSESDFQAWCEGRTGFPIVDAGMRQLTQTGWMHNRLRMITSGFLVKDLHIDWRWGERYFMSQLVDAEFAANNGGWQWSASTGTDAAPYFRIFNPTTQGKRFDPDGDFIRHYVPELAHLNNRDIHTPPPSEAYPAPIVDHSIAREQTLAMFKAVR